MGKRAGSDAAAQLLVSNELQGWQRALDSYEQAIDRLSQEKGRTGLVELDRWWRQDLPSAIRSRGNDPHVTKEELVKVVQWKLWIGAVRPNLLRYARETQPTQVESKSREAFRCLPPSWWTEGPSAAAASTQPVAREALKESVTVLTVIKGVGPATASAVLAAGCGGCPFDADEVIDAVMKTGVRKYTLAEYLKVHEALASKASQLGSPWNAELVRKALWSRAMCSRFNLAAEGCHASPGPNTSAEIRAGAPKGKRRGVPDGDGGGGGSRADKRATGAKRRKKS